MIISKWICGECDNKIDSYQLETVRHGDHARVVVLPGRVICAKCGYEMYREPDNPKEDV